MTCISCHSLETEMYKGTDGHFRKECDSCGHVGGPYVSGYESDNSEKKEGQTGLSDWM